MRIGGQRERHHVAIEVQGIRNGVVLKLGRLIKRGHSGVQTRRKKQCAIHHQAALDVAHTGFAQLPQERPKGAPVQIGVGATAQVQWASQHITGWSHGGQQVGARARVASQQIQGDSGGHHFHGRARLHRTLRIQAQSAPAARNGTCNQTHIVGVHASRLQGLLHGGRKLIMRRPGGASRHRHNT